VSEEFGEKVSPFSARTTLELTVLGVGWLMGGVVSIGTVAYAVAIGPIVHVLLPRLTVRLELVLPQVPTGQTPQGASNAPRPARDVRPAELK
jgi:uncharacterized membrane protein YczE